MTNLNKLYTHYDVSSVKERNVLKNLLVNHLPKEYTKMVINNLKSKGIHVDSQTVRNTKSGISKNILVFNAIVEVAKEFETISNQFKEKLKS
ncbi:hypothetical protein [Hyunsoonleella ulvae]|uniref:hypothetical protein n=1 Tax=Hyunsoonleella ulvae TaxID=2799948 RepID=UPI00193A704F|nr:hypothetical protein [Hyunsoonleella ulvae]